MKETFFQHVPSPESVGISSSNVERLLDIFNENGLSMHSFLMIRYGKIAAEGYWAPFTKDFLHRMYSSTKSFVSGAIGLLCDEGKIHLDDLAHTFFPEYPPETLHPYIRNTKIRDLLRMASPHITTYSLDEKDWVHSFFRTTPQRPPGTIFRYDTSATYILNVIVERITGQPFLEYMKDKMLREVGFSENARCIKSPDGYSWGGSGLLCTTRDMARYAYILLKNGKINGKQLLSAEYIREATAKQLPTSHCRQQPSTYGYGYQIWRYRDTAFAFNGLGNQIAICYPEEDFIFVCTGYNQDVPYSFKLIYDTVHTEIVEKLSEIPLPENPEASANLQNTVSHLSLLLPQGKTESSWQKRINNTEYILEENEMGIQKLSFSFDGDIGIFRYTNAGGEKEIPFGLGKYIEGIFPETHYSGDTIGIPKGSGYRILAAGAWSCENNLVIRVNVTDDYFGRMTAAFGFTDDQIGIIMESSAEGFLEKYHGRAGGKRL